MSSDNHPPESTEPGACGVSCCSGRRIPLVTAVILIGLVVALAVVTAQAFARYGDRRAEADRDANAPMDALLTRTDNRQAIDASTAYRWADVQKTHVSIPMADASRMLIAQSGRPGWATTQPVIERIAVSQVAGMNQKKVAAGMRVYQSLCAQCHTTDGRPGVGPSLMNAFGSQIELADGTKLTVDEAYLRESIRMPVAKLHKGYPPAMPDFGPAIRDRDLDNLTEFIRSISPEPANRQLLGPIAAPPQ